ncbi:interferon-related developmental regulator 2-like, partial [Microcaecilia unicolor]
MPRARKGNSQKKGGRGSLRQELLQLQVSAKANRLKGARNGAKDDSQASDDEVASEVLSHYSSASETTSVVEEGTVSEGVDEQTLQDEREDKLKESIDSVMDR